jgi:glucokinase
MPEVIGDAGRALGIAMGGALNLLDLPLVVVGGGVAGLGEPFLGGIRCGIAAAALPEVAKGCRVEAARAGPEAGAHGAALTALDLHQNRSAGGSRSTSGAR